jgi:hypothetical protein
MRRRRTASGSRCSSSRRELNNPNIVDGRQAGQACRADAEVPVRGDGANGLTVATFDTNAEAHKFITQQMPDSGAGRIALEDQEVDRRSSGPVHGQPQLAENEALGLRQRACDPAADQRPEVLGARVQEPRASSGSTRSSRSARAVQTYLSRAYTGYNPSFIAATRSATSGRAR